jgi:putative ABC transport system permease protein
MGEELRLHLEQQIAANVAAGMTSEQAGRQARLQLGAVEGVKANCREERRGFWLESLWCDVRYGLRILRKSRGFTAVAVITLALGIGANTAIFTIVNGFLLRSLPVPDAGQIMAIAVQEKGFPLGTRGFSYPGFVDVRRQTAPAADVFANVINESELTDNQTTEFCAVSYISSNFFTALGITPYMGRFILPSEAERPGSGSTVVLGYAYWRRRFGSAAVLGTQVLIDGRPVTIVGIAPKSFHGMFSIFQMDAYLPMSAIEANPSGRFWTSRDQRRLLVFGRLRSGVTIWQAQSAIDVVASQLARQYPNSDGIYSFRVLPERLARPQPYANNYFLMAGGLFLGLAGFVFLLACINVENLLLGRTVARQRELGIRAALGARRARLIRQMIAENLLLAALGGLTGAGLGLITNRLVGSIHLEALQPDVTFDWRVFGYVVLSVALAAIAVSLFPAFRASRADVNEVLHDRQPGTGMLADTFRSRNLLVVAQIAGSMMLLVVAALLVRSLREARNLNLGFDPRHVLNVTFDPTDFGYDRTRTVEFYRQLESHVTSLPGVQSAALSSNVPLSSFPCKLNVYVENRPLARGQSPPRLLCNGIDGSYFSVMRIPLLRGRDFTVSDDQDSAPVAIINQTMARQFWPGEDAVGERFSAWGPNGPFLQIVGIVADSKYLTIMEDPEPSFYFPVAQNFAARRTLLVRTFGEPQSLAGPIKQAAASVASGVPPLNVETMQHSLEGAFGFFTIRLAAALAGIMGGVGLVLAVVGVYGVVSFALARRTREFGIRLTLGARPGDILRLVLRQGLWLALSGVALGFLLTRALASTVAHVLFGVSATDPTTLAGVAILLVSVMLVACWIPARRAVRVDPLVALRHE